jgi:hypothetical protein
MLKSLLVFVFAATVGRAASPEVVELTFDNRWNQPAATNGLPAWIHAVEQRGGVFSDQPASWRCDAGQPTGVGRLSIVLDRQLMAEDLAMSLLYDEDANADVAIQLLDIEDRAVVLDVFGNLMAVGREAKTDTFILPLRKYPTVTKIAIRRITGSVRVYGAALYPVVTEAEADPQTLEQLARLLGDPLSPQNPLVKSIDRLANGGKHAQQWLASPTLPASSAARVFAKDEWGPLDWHIQPFPVDSDWPGARGMPAEWENGELILTGQPVRSRRSFTAPVRISCEVELDQRSAHDGGMTFMFEPEGVPLDHQGEQKVAFAMNYGHNGADDGTGHLVVWQLLALRENFHPVGKTLWGEEPFALKAGKRYRVELEITADGMRAAIDGKAYRLDGAGVPYRRFRLSLEGWQPTNRWHIHNFTVH